MSREGKQPELSDAKTEEEIRRGRRFTPSEAIARLAGPGAMKGASPVSPKRQAEATVSCWIRDHVPDGAGSANAAD